MQKTKMKKRCRDGVTCVVLCTLSSIYLVCVVFGTAIPTFFYILENVFHTLHVGVGQGILYQTCIYVRGSTSVTSTISACALPKICAKVCSAYKQNNMPKGTLTLGWHLYLQLDSTYS